MWDYIRSLGSGGQVYAEVRGWRFDLVAPRYRYRPSPSEVASYCPTRRELYLRRVLGLRVEPGPQARYGVVVHEFFLEPFRLVGRGVRGLGDLYAGMRRLGRRLGVRVDGFLEEVYTLASGLALGAFYDSGLPVRVEPEIPGGPVGLSDVVRPDLLVGLVPVEVTTSPVAGRLGEAKELQVAGYALALEAWTGVPVDYGVVLHVGRVDGSPRLSWRVVVVDDSLRRRFLRARDEAAMIVDDGVDPGAAGGGCPVWCPFLGSAPGCPSRRSG